MDKPIKKKEQSFILRFSAAALFFLAVCFPVCAADSDRAVSLNLADEAKKLDASLYWDSLSGSGVLVRDGHQMSFRAGRSVVLLDYRELVLLDAPVVRADGVFVTSAFIRSASDFFETLPPPALYRVGAILIDPGHGGRDTGAVGEHTVNGKKISAVEKDIALTIAADLCGRLKKTYPDKKIIMTRTGDTYPTLEQRVEMANSVKLDEHEAILYISVHANSAFNKKASGFEVWYLTQDYRRTVISGTEIADKEILPILNSMMEEEFTTESVLIAKFILDELDNQIGRVSANRGLKEEEWFVVRNANMPSVLIEVGFVSNPEEAALLNEAAYLRKISSGIYNGLTAFITHFERSRGFTNAQ